MTQSRGSPCTGRHGFESPGGRRRCDGRCSSAILGKPEYSTLPRLDIPAQYAISQSFTAEQSSRTHRKPKQLPLKRRSPCFPTTQPLPNFKPLPLLRVKRNCGTTGLSRWILSAPWSLDNSNNQQRWRYCGTTGRSRWIHLALSSLDNSNNQQRWREMWINFLTTGTTGNSNNFKSENRWRKRNQTGLK